MKHRPAPRRHQQVAVPVCWIMICILASAPIVNAAQSMESSSQYLSDDLATSESLPSGSGHVVTADKVAQEEDTCDAVLHKPSKEACQYVRKYCHDESILQFLIVYYCYGQHVEVIMKPLILLVSSFTLLCLFKIMGLTADQYFSNILSQISQDVGMPPRLAGVTLLALGNGAPDLSSSIAAVKSGHPHIALGSLIGSVMFVGCVVAGRLISLHKNGVKSRGAQIRDILALLGAVVAVTWILLLGKMTYGCIVLLIGLYGTYVLVVAIADFSKRAGVEWMGIFRLYSSSDDEMKNKSLMERMKIALLPESVSALEHLDYETLPGTDEVEVYSTTQEGRTSSPDSLGNSSELEMTESPRKKGPVSDRNTWAPNSSNRSGGLEHKSYLVDANRVDTQTHASGSSSTVHRATTEPAPSSVATKNYDELVHMSAREYRARALADMSDAKTIIKNMDEHDTSFPSQTEEETMYEEEDIYDEIEQQQSARREERGKHVRFKEEDIRMQQSGIEEQRRRPALSRSPSSILLPNRVRLVILYSHIREAINVCITPATYLLKATVPLLEQTSYNRTWFLLSCFFSPFWTLFIFEAMSLTSIGIALVSSLFLVFIAYLGTSSLDTDTPPFWDFGTGFPIGSSIVALYGFALAATWIDKIATEIVSIIRFFGILGGVSPAILGLTVLAWGNSLTDFFSNISMAGKSKDGVSMAMTACFAGPLFNLLIGLGVGFLALFTDTGTSSAHVPFDLIVFVGCMFAVVNCLVIVAIAIHNGMSLPAWSGWLMMVWYAIYMLVTCIVEWSSDQNQ
eukprot:jgi/Picsp_1/6143/NSC_03497-R1_cation calcium exchanger 4